MLENFSHLWDRTDVYQWHPKDVRSFFNITWFTKRPDDDPAGSKHVANLTINSK